MQLSPVQKVRSRQLVGRWFRRIALGAIVASVVVGIVLAWMPRPIAVDSAIVTRRRLTVTVNEDGRARVKDRYVIFAPLSGSLDRITLRPGSDVQQGAVIARLLPAPPALLDERSRTQAEARLLAAQAAERQANLQVERVRGTKEQAKTDADRSRELFRTGSIPKAELERSLLVERTTLAELESLRFGSRVASYEVEMARAAVQHLSTTKRGTAFEIPAPVTGRVLRVLRDSEGVVQAGTPLLEIGEPDALEIVADVLTSDAVRIQPEAPVSLERWGGAALEGRVRQVEPSAFTRVNALGVEEQRVNVVIDIVDPKERWSALGDGYRIEARIVVWERHDVVQVPLSATFRNGDGWAVYRIEGDRARLSRVELGERTMAAAEVTKGLEPGTQVIVHPSDKVDEGVKLRVR